MELLHQRTRCAVLFSQNRTVLTQQSQQLKKAVPVGDLLRTFVVRASSRGIHAASLQQKTRNQRRNTISKGRMENAPGPLAAQGQPTQQHAGKVPPTIPDYEILHYIGSGAYGEVWLARNQATQTLRAVKIVYRATFTDERLFNRVKKQDPTASQSRQTQSPNYPRRNLPPPRHHQPRALGNQLLKRRRVQQIALAKRFPIQPIRPIQNHLVFFRIASSPLVRTQKYIHRRLLIRPLTRCQNDRGTRPGTREFHV
jgi:hypothetical protein